MKWLQTRHIVVEAYSPLAHGTRMGETVLKELGKKYNKSPAQIMIRWCLQRVSFPIFSFGCSVMVFDAVG